MKAAVIDLGFNSLKMVCYSVDGRGQFRPYRQDAFRAKLGEGLDDSGFLGSAQMRRTINYLRALSEIAVMEGVERVIPIATSAVREAANGREFVRAVLDETKFAFRVLSGNDEALYSFAGAVGFAPMADVVFFDLGGGSLELVSSIGFQIRKIVSLPLGALRLSLDYGDGSGNFSKRDTKMMKKRILDLLPKPSELQVSRRARLVGVGGTVRALARRDQEGSAYPFPKIQSYRIPYRSVNSMSKSFLRMTKKDLGKEREIGNRAETIAPGTLVVRILMRALGIQELTVSARGLKEGALSMYLQDSRSFHAGSVTETEIERFVRRSASERAALTEGHAGAVEKARLVDRREAELLAEAHRLISQAPPSVNLRGLFYSILEEDSTVGQREQLIIAAVGVTARNDRIADLMVDQYKKLLTREDRDRIKKLAALYAFIETTGQAGGTFKVSRRGGDVSFRVIEGKGRLPVALLAQQVDAIGSKFDLRVDLSWRSGGKEIVAGTEGQ